jgi:predicted nucleotidyltransferase
MSVPSPIPLDDFERAIHADPEVLGMFYFGSLGRGAAGRFSDLDIFVWFADDVAPRERDKLLQLFGLLGQIHWLELEWSKAWLGPEWT